MFWDNDVLKIATIANRAVRLSFRNNNSRSFSITLTVSRTKDGEISRNNIYTTGMKQGENLKPGECWQQISIFWMGNRSQRLNSYKKLPKVNKNCIEKQTTTKKNMKKGQIWDKWDPHPRQRQNWKLCIKIGHWIVLFYVSIYNMITNFPSSLFVMQDGHIFMVAF